VARKGSSEQFTIDLTAFVKKAKGRADALVRKVVLDLGARVVMRSPVGDASYWKNPPPKGYTGGHFRANWQYGESVRPSGNVEGVDKSGRLALGKMGSKVRLDGAAGRTHFLVNNLPYALRIEHGWSARQAPNGVVGVTVIEYRQVVRNALRAIK
jgi:hypothetical protein